MVIENPNSSGQGYDAGHLEHPLHATVVKYGYVYSHTTPVHALDNSVYMHHTYKAWDKNLGTHNVGLMHSNIWETSVSTSSGRNWTGKGAAELDAHLKSKRRRYGIK